MSLPAPSNVMPPSSQAVKTQLIIDFLVKIKQKNLDNIGELVETFKMRNELLDENIRIVTSKMDKVRLLHNLRK